MFRRNWFYAVGDDLFTRTKDLRNVENAFRGKSNMTGTITPIWNTSEYKNITSYALCFQGCTSLSNYNDIPSTWKNA